MMTAPALPEGQEKTGWKWEQWLNTAGEFYRNVVRLRKLHGGGNSYILSAQRNTHPDPNAMDVDKINLSPRERAEHMRNRKCFICHKEGCHLSKHWEYPGKRGQGRTPPQGECSSWRKNTESTREVKTDPLVADYMRQHRISPENTMELLGNYYSHNRPASAWEKTAKEESVNLVEQGF